MQRPHVFVNVAMTADGKIDTLARKGATISSTADKERVDCLRTSVDAVMVGGRTLLNEDPSLTIQSPERRAERIRLGLPENPAKVGVVTVANLKVDGHFMNTGPAMRYIFTSHLTPSEKVSQLEFMGATVFISDQEKIDLLVVMNTLYCACIRSMLVEGGGTLLAELFRLSCVDELSIYIAPKIFGGATAPTLADGPGFSIGKAPRLRLVSVEGFDKVGGVLLHYLVDR